MILDPNTWSGSVYGQVVAGILTVVLCSIFGIFAWPIKWWRNSRKMRKLLLESGTSYNVPVKQNPPSAET
jgi:hypothetical protein